MISPQHSVFGLQRSVMSIDQEQYAATTTEATASDRCILMWKTPRLYPSRKSSVRIISCAIVLLLLICVTRADEPATGENVKKQSIDDLVKSLKSDDEFKRDNAMFALVEIGSDAVPALLKLVDDQAEVPSTPPEDYDLHYGKNVRSSLGWNQFGFGKQYYPVNLTVNRNAIRALGLIGDDAAFKAIRDQHRKSKKGLRLHDALIGAECLRALVGIRGKKTPIQPGMLAWHYAEIGSRDAAIQLRTMAKGILKWNHSKGHSAELGRWLSTKDKKGEHLFDAVGALRLDSANNTILQLIKSGVKNNWKWLHNGSHDSPDFFHLMGSGWDNMFTGLLAAERAAGEIGIEEAVPLLKKRKEDKNIMVRVFAARALAQMGDADALDLVKREVRWRHTAFVKEYTEKLEPWTKEAWLRLWVNEDQKSVPPDGQVWLRNVPNWHCLVGYEALGYIDTDKARRFLIKRTKDILGLVNIDRFYQTDLLWLGIALKRQGEKELMRKALKQGMRLFDRKKAYDYELRHFHLAALMALSKLNQPDTLPAVVRTMLHHPSSWRPGVYHVRDVAWGVYLTLKGRRDANRPVRTTDLVWYY